MLRSLVGASRASRLLLNRTSITTKPTFSIPSLLSSQFQPQPQPQPKQYGVATFSTKKNSQYKPGAGVPPEQMPYYHHTKKFDLDTTTTTPLPPQKKNNNNNNNKPPKFKSPRKRASKLFHNLNKSAAHQSTLSNPSVHQVPYRVGDAIEIEVISSGGIKSTSNLDKIRGVVLGKKNKGLSSSVFLRDVMYGEPIDRQIMLHSPLVKSLKVLERNFVHKGKKKVKRAKLYYLRDRLPVETRVTKW